MGKAGRWKSSSDVLTGSQVESKRECSSSFALVIGLRFERSRHKFTLSVLIEVWAQQARALQPQGKESARSIRRQTIALRNVPKGHVWPHTILGLACFRDPLSCSQRAKPSSEITHDLNISTIHDVKGGSYFKFTGVKYFTPVAVPTVVLYRPHVNTDTIIAAYTNTDSEKATRTCFAT